MVTLLIMRTRRGPGNDTALRRAAGAALFGLLPVVALSGCKDSQVLTPPPSPADVRGIELTSQVPRGAVQAAVQQQAMATDGTVTFSVRVLANGVGVSAYSGSVTFAPGTFELVDISTPAGQDGEARFHNAAGFAEGVVRFAGFTPTTFSGTQVGDGAEALRFTVRPLAPVEGANLRAALTVVSGETGVAISADQVLASPGVYGPDGRLIR